MELRYVSTRNNGERVIASEAILKGLAEDGGLFVPTEIPSLALEIDELAALSYQETAYEVMRLFFTDFTEEELKSCIAAAYDGKFDTKEIVPLADVCGTYYLELFHGQTIAFKDMALSILPHLLTTAARKLQAKKEIVILTATSGDTGKAALAGFADVPGTKVIVFYPKNGVSPIQERQMVTQKGANTFVVGINGNFDLAGFADVPGTKVIVFYPKNGVSPIQERQMVTQKGANTFVVGINGNFDEAQTGVKQMFADRALEAQLAAAGYQLSSANSINIGRLVPQIVYYVYAYARLYANGVLARDEKVNVVVPTGNFGNILAAFYAKQMGLPIGKLICASNENKVLYDFFSTGIYDKNRPFVLTSSPSMDILVSSNLERLLYHISGNDAQKNGVWMKQLAESGRYEITPEMREKLQEFFGGYSTERLLYHISGNDAQKNGVWMKQLAESGRYEITPEMREKLQEFFGGYSTEEETAEMIRALYEKTGYLIDPHTAVAAVVFEKYRRQTGDTDTKAVIASTASPFKFTRSVMHAIDAKYDGMEDFALAEEMSAAAKLQIPHAIEEIRDAKVLHDTVCEVSHMQEAVKKFLKLS